MRVSKDDLLVSANQRAAELGMPPYTMSVIESWIGLGFLDCATPHGRKRALNPTWDYPEEARRRIVQIVGFQAQGAQRSAQKLLCLWAFGHIFNYVQVIEALKSELRRIVKRQGRGPAWWKYHYTAVRNLSASERSDLIRRLPELDTDLAATPLRLSGPALLEILLRAYWGSDSEETIPKTISADLAQTAGIPIDGLMGVIRLLPLNISGALGPPRESANGGYEILDYVSNNDLEAARSLLWLCVFGLLAGNLFFGFFGLLPNSKLALAYEKALNSFLRPEWIIPTLALFAISTYQARMLKMAQKMAK
jgi:hypothetical protein